MKGKKDTSNGKAPKTDAQNSRQHYNLAVGQPILKSAKGPGMAKGSTKT